MGVIAIDYQTLTLVVILLFAAVGFTRGWVQEGVTTVLLILLVGLLYKPDLVEPVMALINTILKLIRSVIKVGVGRFSAQAGAPSPAAMPDIFTPENPYNFLLWTLIILILLSYAGTRVAMRDRPLSPLSRVLGGIAGAINGFIAISLFKEYLLGYFQNLTAEQAAAAAQIQTVGAPPDGLSVAVQNVPQQPFIQSAGPLLAGMAAVMIIILILSSVFKWNIR